MENLCCLNEFKSSADNRWTGQLWQRLVVAVCPKLFEQTLLSLSVASNAEVMGYLYKRSAVMEIQESEKEENHKSRIEI